MNNLTQSAREVENRLNEVSDLIVKVCYKETDLKDMSADELHALQAVTKLIDAVSLHNLQMAYRIESIDKKLDKLLSHKNRA